MKTHALLLILSLLAAPAWPEDIASVLERSQAGRLDGLAPSTAPGAVALQRSFDRLLKELHPSTPAELKVVDVGVIAETLRGRTIVLNSALGELPEVCRLFLLAHELGHIQAGHWAQRIALYRKYIPGEVVQDQTDAIAPQLGREASMQAHQQEFDADAYAMRTMLDMGYSRDELLDMFMRLGNYSQTATHPSSGKRMAQLRMIDEERRMAKVSTGEAAH